MEKFILSLDQGTTSSRAILFDKNGNTKSVVQREFKQLYPKSGWVEHDPEEIWTTQYMVAKECIVRAGLQDDQIESIGITNQRETVILWDRTSGKPIYNAIVWQDRRTSDFCDQLKEDGLSKIIAEKTGLVIDAYFSASKIKWVLDQDIELRNKAENGKLAFGTVDTWLLWKLTQGAVHVTDVTNASRTMLYNIYQMDWDHELLELFNIPKNILPAVKSSSEIYERTARGLFNATIPIAGIAGDQQAALFGQMCTKKGMVKNTYGTGCFMLMNIGNKPITSENNLVTTIAWKIGKEVLYALEGSIFIAGAVVQWLRDELGLIQSSEEIEKLASSVENSGGVTLVPAFTGLGAPYWDQDARGTIVGITRGTSSAHIARVALNSIALQTMDILKAMELDSGTSIQELRVDGGASVNDLLMQIQSDVLGTNVIRPRITEVTALGAAYLAGLAVGYWEDLESIQSQWQVEREFHPTGHINNEEMVVEWKRAIHAARMWAKGS